MNLYKATVMKFNGTSWVKVGSSGFSTGKAKFINLAFNPVGMPYVAFQDWGNAKKATVMKFDGPSWVYEGMAGFSEGEAEFTSLAFSQSGEPYVAYDDYIPPHTAVVKKFDGNNWVYVGTEFTQGNASWISLAFSPSNEPYVAYNDQDFAFKACVKRYHGGYWSYVGSWGFSGGWVFDTRLVFSPSGEPYIVYSDQDEFLKATVMKYDSVIVGVTKFDKSIFSLYPNPVIETLRIDIKNIPGSIKDIEIYNMVGLKIFVYRTITDKMLFNVGHFPSGMYILKINANNESYFKKFIKINVP
jgi:hypothetical protein